MDRFELRPDPTTGLHVALWASCALVFAGVGVAMVCGSVAVSDDTMLRVWLGIFGVPFAAGGALLLYSLWTSKTTLLRLTLDEHAVLLEWLRRGRVLRAEHVGREDLKDLIISYRRDDDDVAWYQLILRTTQGDVPIHDNATSLISPLAKQRRQLESFLDLPAAAE